MRSDGPTQPRSFGLEADMRQRGALDAQLGRPARQKRPLTTDLTHGPERTFVRCAADDGSSALLTFFAAR